MRRASLWESSGSSPPTASTTSQCTPPTRTETSRSWRWRTSKSDSVSYICCYRGADKSLARPGRKQARKHVRDAGDFNKIETRAVIKFLFLQGKAPKKIHAILTETLASFLPGRAKDLSGPCIALNSWWWTERPLESCRVSLNKDRSTWCHLLYYFTIYCSTCFEC